MLGHLRTFGQPAVPGLKLTHTNPILLLTTRHHSALLNYNTKTNTYFPTQSPSSNDIVSSLPTPLLQPASRDQSCFATIIGTHRHPRAPRAGEWSMCRVLECHQSLINYLGKRRNNINPSLSTVTIQSVSRLMLIGENVEVVGTNHGGKAP